MGAARDPAMRTGAKDNMGHGPGITEQMLAGQWGRSTWYKGVN